MDIKTKYLKELKEIIKKDYGINLTEENLLVFAEKITKLTLIAKKHYLRRIVKK